MEIPRGTACELSPAAQRRWQTGSTGRNCRHAPTSALLRPRGNGRLGANPVKHRPSRRAASRRFRRDARRISAQVPALRPIRVRAVLGRRRGARPAADLHTATRRQGKIRGAGDKTLRDASSRATKAFYPALSMCDLIFSGVFERHPRLRVAIVEFELAWAPHLLSTMDYTYRERHGEAISRFKTLPSRRRGTACSRATSSAATSS